MEMLTRNQKLAIIRTICLSPENRCNADCFLRIADALEGCKDKTALTDEELDRTLWEIFRRCGITYRPEKRAFKYITREVRTSEDAKVFIDAMTQGTKEGFKLESSGINGDASHCSVPLAWAIMSRPED